jgi:hypothetical protein
MGGAPDISGVPSVFDFIRESFPPGAELVGFVAPDGQTYSGEQLKAVERQESNVQEGQAFGEGLSISENIRKILQDADRVSNEINRPKEEFTLKKLFKFGETLYMLRSDDSLWFLMESNEGPGWIRVREHALPQIPQEL